MPNSGDSRSDCRGYDLSMTLNYPEEAMGFARAARQAGMPVAISFSVETDGRLPGGQKPGGDDQAVVDATAAIRSYFLVNCATPTFSRRARRGGSWENV